MFCCSEKKSMLSSQEKPIDSLEHFDLNCSVLVPAVRSVIIVRRTLVKVN